MSASRDGSSGDSNPEYSDERAPAGAASWWEEVQLLLDPSLSPGARTTLLQDVAKRAPAAGRDAVSDACSSLGLEGVDDVLTQMSEDLGPDLARNGPRLAADVLRQLPKLGANAANLVQGGGGIGGAPGAAEDVLRVLGGEVKNSLRSTPEGVEAVPFEVESYGDGFELRNYQQVDVASVDIELPSGDAVDVGELEGATALADAFSALAGFLLGSNSNGKVLKTMTPFFITVGPGGVATTLSVVLCDPAGGVPDAVGAAGGRVYFGARTGGLYAARTFGGLATGGAIRRARAMLLKALPDGEAVCEIQGVAGCTVALYNGPGTVAFVRRNEVLLRLETDDGVDGEMAGGGSYDDLSSVID